MSDTRVLQLTRWAIVRNILGSLLILLGTAVLAASLEQTLDPENAEALLLRAGVAAIGAAALILVGSGLAYALFIIGVVHQSRKHGLSQAWMIIRFFIPVTGVALTVSTSLLFAAGMASLELPQAVVTIIGAVLTVVGVLLSTGFWLRAWGSIGRAWRNNTARPS